MKKRVLKVLGNLDITVSGITAVALILLTFAGVIRRYIFRDPITWMEEMQMIMFVWVIFLAAGAAFRTGGHIAIEIVVDSLPKSAKRAVEFVDVLIELLILIYLFIQSCIYYLQLTSTGKLTTLLRIPYSFAYVAVPLGCFLMIVSLLFTEISGRLARRKRGDEEKL